MALLDGLGQAFKALDCAVLSGGDYILGGIGRFTGLDQGLAVDAINGLRRLRGCDPANDVVPAPPPFSGGQCPVLYQFRRTGTDSSGTPISENQFICSGQYGGPLAVEKRVNGATATFVVTSRRVNGTPQETILFSGPNTEQINVTIKDVVRCDGNPDTCGDPAPILPPPTNFDIDVDVEFTDEGDNIVNITIPVEFKPFTVNFNGDVSFPFDFNLGGLDFNGSVSFNPDFSFNVAGPQLPPGPINPTDPSGDQPPDVPLAPRGNKVQGVIVTATLAQNIEASAYNMTGAPDIFVPRLGSVKFAYSFGAATVWSNDLDVKGTRVFIPCPFSQGADAVVASPQPGVSFAIAQVTGPPIATVADLTATG